MLRLVRLSVPEVTTLFSLVSNMPDTPQKANYLAGLSNYTKAISSAPEGTATNARMMLLPEMHSAMIECLKQPFLPADATRLGIPAPEYLAMVSSIPGLLRAFEECDHVAQDSFSLPITQFISSEYHN
jgi:hypothetical protein